MDKTNLTVKQQAIRALETLPDGATIEDAIDCLEVLRDVQVGLAQADAGLVFPHEAVMKYFLGEQVDDADPVDRARTQ